MTNLPFLNVQTRPPHLQLTKIGYATLSTALQNFSLNTTIIKTISWLNVRIHSDYELSFNAHKTQSRNTALDCHINTFLMRLVPNKLSWYCKNCYRIRQIWQTTYHSAGNSRMGYGDQTIGVSGFAVSCSSFWRK